MNEYNGSANQQKSTENGSAFDPADRLATLLQKARNNQELAAQVHSAISAHPDFLRILQLGNEQTPGYPDALNWVKNLWQELVPNAEPSAKLETASQTNGAEQPKDTDQKSNLEAQLLADVEQYWSQYRQLISKNGEPEDKKYYSQLLLDVSGVSPSAIGEKEIREALKKIRKQFHPDRAFQLIPPNTKPQDHEPTRLMTKILQNAQAAAVVLLDTAQKSSYDWSVGAAHSTRTSSRGSAAQEPSSNAGRPNESKSQGSYTRPADSAPPPSGESPADRFAREMREANEKFKNDMEQLKRQSAFREAVLQLKSQLNEAFLQSPVMRESLLSNSTAFAAITTFLSEMRNTAFASKRTEPAFARLSLQDNKGMDLLNKFKAIIETQRNSNIQATLSGNTLEVQFAAIS